MCCVWDRESESGEEVKGKGGKRWNGVCWDGLKTWSGESNCGGG